MRKITILLLAVVLACTLLLLACDKKKTSENSGDEKVAENAEASKNEPAKEITFDADPKPVEYYGGSHILIAYNGAMRAKPEVTRTKEEAQKLATELADKVAKNPAQFETLAKENSDCSSAPRGGDLGYWQSGMMAPEFDKAVSELKVGGITAAPVETSFGYHVIRRNEALKREDVAAQLILVGYKEALMQRKPVDRTKADAEARIKEALGKAKAAPDNFVEIAKEYSDDTSINLPTWQTGTGRMPPEFDRTLVTMKVGDISDVVETPYGFAFFKRVPLPARLSGSHILIQFAGAMRAPQEMTRSKDDAKKLANEILAEVRKTPDKFDEIAQAKSEDPSAKMNKGFLGVWEEGRMIKEFDDAVKKMKDGEISDVVETAFGFHIIQRRAIEEAK